MSHHSPIPPIAPWLHLPRRKSTATSTVGAIAEIRATAARLKSKSDYQLAEAFAELRERQTAHRHSIRRIAHTPPADLVEAMALTCEAARRVLGVDLYDVQLQAGIVLAKGAIAEMQTGEGKTFTALFPAVWHAIRGEGVHVMTVNPYLASRDCELLTPVLVMLGLRVGSIDRGIEPAQKRDAYAADVTFGAGCEFGFDFLRDELGRLAQERLPLGAAFRSALKGRAGDVPLPMQRGRSVAIVDEADSVMIDEATTPLILAGSAEGHFVDGFACQKACELATKMAVGRHFVLDRLQNSLQLTAEGALLAIRVANEMQSVRLNRAWAIYVKQALRARHLFQRDVHYIVDNDEIHLVDQETGRVMEDRSWQDGLQQAVEAKEAVSVSPETTSLARITRQKFFSLYDHLCGMTGTAVGNERELRRVYGLDVQVIPTHRPCVRQQLPLRAFGNRDLKEAAIVADAIQRQAMGQPVLIGTPSIEASNRMAKWLGAQQVEFALLNGSQDATEASIIANAGASGVVTIATNMAGRGTDIKLSGEAVACGGLHVIVSEPQDSARAMRQLVGRAARQGDPGSCQTFVAADDVVLAEQDPKTAAWLRHASADSELAETGPIERSLARIQTRSERQRSRKRQELFTHDDWLETAKMELGSG